MRAARCGVVAFALVVALAACSGGGDSTPMSAASPPVTPERAKPLVASGTAALERWPALRRSIAADEPTDVVRCAAQYLGDDEGGQPGGRLYLWAVCERLVGGQEAGSVSAPYRLTAGTGASRTWTNVETLPDNASDEQVARLFPLRLQDAARGQGVAVDTLQRDLAGRREGPAAP